jgi:hypothetical protein
MNDASVTPAEFYHSLRASTAALLGYNVDHLSAAEAVRVDRALTLRLIVDHMQSRQMQGGQIDAKEFVAASEALERMVGGTPDAPVSFDVDGVIADLERSIQGILDVRALKAAEADTHPGGGNVDLATVSPSVADGRAQSGGASSSSPPAAPEQRETDVERMTRVNSSGPPDHYLKQDDGEWRKFVGPDGEIIAPYWRGGYG